MNQFITKLKLEKIHKDKDDKQWYKLKDDLTLEYDNRRIVVKKGYQTDLTTIPYPLSKWIKRDSRRYIRSAIVHDWFYEFHYSRLQADNWFWKAMGIEGTPLRYKIPMYLAVRIFGGKYWDDIRKF